MQIILSRPVIWHNYLRLQMLYSTENTKIHKHINQNLFNSFIVRCCILWEISWVSSGSGIQWNPVENVGCKEPNVKHLKIIPCHWDTLQQQQLSVCFTCILPTPNTHWGWSLKCFTREFENLTFLNTAISDITYSCSSVRAGCTNVVVVCGMQLTIV